MTSQPKVSVLIPVFNRKDYIAECIQSALDQTFTDFEIIVVDNASYDGTWEICQQFALADQRVRIFRNDKNIGPVRNWIRCTQEAKGSLAKMLFSDDLLAPDCLNQMVEVLNDDSVGLVYSAAMIGPSYKNFKLAYTGAPSRLSTKFFLKKILDGEAPLSPGAAMLRLDDLRKNLKRSYETSTQREFEKNGAGPDVMVLLSTSMSYMHVAVLQEPLVFFRVHLSSFSIQNTNRSIEKGYRSVFALFIKENFANCLPLYWAQSWIDEIRILRKWKNLQKHIVEYEGVGSLIEQYRTLSFVPSLVTKMFARKLKLFFFGQQ